MFFIFFFFFSSRRRHTRCLSDWSSDVCSSDLFAEATQISTTPETLYNYASFLKTANRRDEAREWAQKILAKTRTLPRYMQRRERPWFRKGKALLKELTSSS